MRGNSLGAATMRATLSDVIPALAAVPLLLAAPEAAVRPSAQQAVARMTLDFDGHGRVEALETLRTPGVREGLVAAGPYAGGWAMEIETNAGTVRVLQGPDGSALQSVPMGDGTWRTIASDGPLAGCGGAVEVPRVPAGPRPAALGCDDGSQVDVLVKWTPSAEAAAGGPTAIRAVAEASVAMSNHVYLASGVNLRMRAVGYSITEPYSGDAGDPLGEVTSPDDGLLDAVHAERDAAGADLVALLTAAHPSYCGVAYLLGEPFPDYGFSVTVWSCALGGLTFTHEVGHNQGCCHAPGDGGGCTSGGVFSYSVGHRFIATNATQYRTAMAYSPGTRIPRLSNPAVSFIGTPTGLATADNARTLNETAAVMANFRCALPDDGARDHVVSPLLDVPTSSQPVSFTATSVPRAASGSTVEILVSAIGNLGAASESLSLRIGTTNLGTVIGNMGTDCGQHARRTAIPASTFNAAVGTGASVPFTLLASFASPGSCSYREARVVLRYRAGPPPCPADLNGDGSVTGADIGALLGAWGACPAGCAADLDGSGAVNGADLGVLLGAWGACPQ